MRHHSPGCLGDLHCVCYPVSGPVDPHTIVSDNVYDVDGVTLSHQIRRDGTHRLVLCCEPPQVAGDWISANCWAKVGNYRASFREGVVNGKKIS